MLTNRITRAVVFLACLIPAALLWWRWTHFQLTANPIEGAEHMSGDWTLRFVILTLCITPVRRLPGLASLIRYRRMLGLYAVFYGCIHFTIYLWYDKGLQWLDIRGDFLSRKFYTFGLIAFLLMLPLALTSTAASIRWLGGKRWQRLHRLIYVTAAAGAVHYLLQGKHIELRAVKYAIIVAALLLYRVVMWVVRKNRNVRPAAVPLRTPV